ncbi:hypothetical protein JCM11641_005496 [Rhodosporidiobolus odoratus]
MSFLSRFTSKSSSSRSTPILSTSSDSNPSNPTSAPSPSPSLALNLPTSTLLSDTSFASPLLLRSPLRSTPEGQEDSDLRSLRSVETSLWVDAGEGSPKTIRREDEIARNREREEREWRRAEKARLGVQEVGLVVEVCGGVIRSRGLTTLGLFRPYRLAESPSRQLKLIALFLDYCNEAYPTTSSSLTAENEATRTVLLHQWKEEVRYAKVEDAVGVVKWAFRHLTYPPSAPFSSLPSSPQNPLAFYPTFLPHALSPSPRAFSSSLLPLLPPSSQTLLIKTLEFVQHIVAFSSVNAMSSRRLCRSLGLYLFFGSAGIPPSTGHGGVNDGEGDVWESLYRRWQMAGEVLDGCLRAYLREEGEEKLPPRLKELVGDYEGFVEKQRRMFDSKSPLMAVEGGGGGRQVTVLKVEVQTRPTSALAGGWKKAGQEEGVNDQITGLLRKGTNAGGDHTGGRPARRKPVEIFLAAFDPSSSSAPSPSSSSALSPSSPSLDANASTIWQTLLDAVKGAKEGEKTQAVLDEEVVRVLRLLGLDEPSPTPNQLPSPRSRTRSQDVFGPSSSGNTHPYRNGSTTSGARSAGNLLLSGGGSKAVGGQDRGKRIVTPSWADFASTGFRGGENDGVGELGFLSSPPTSSTTPRTPSSRPSATPSAISGSSTPVSTTSKIVSLTLLSLDEEFSDVWIDTLSEGSRSLLSPLANWPGLIIAPLRSSLLPSSLPTSGRVEQLMIYERLLPYSPSTLDRALSSTTSTTRPSLSAPSHSAPPKPNTSEDPLSPHKKWRRRASAIFSSSSSSSSASASSSTVPGFPRRQASEPSTRTIPSSASSTFSSTLSLGGMGRRGSRKSVVPAHSNEDVPPVPSLPPTAAMTTGRLPTVPGTPPPGIEKELPMPPPLAIEPQQTEAEKEAGEVKGYEVSPVSSPVESPQVVAETAVEPSSMENAPHEGVEKSDETDGEVGKDVPEREGDAEAEEGKDESQAEAPAGEQMAERERKPSLPTIVIDEPTSDQIPHPEPVSVEAHPTEDPSSDLVPAPPPDNVDSGAAQAPDILAPTAAPTSEPFTSPHSGGHEAPSSPSSSSPAEIHHEPQSSTSPTFVVTPPPAVPHTTDGHGLPFLAPAFRPDLVEDGETEDEVMFVEDVAAPVKEEKNGMEEEHKGGEESDLNFPTTDSAETEGSAGPERQGERDEQPAVEISPASPEEADLPSTVGQNTARVGEKRFSEETVRPPSPDVEEAGGAVEEGTSFRRHYLPSIPSKLNSTDSAVASKAPMSTDSQAVSEVTADKAQEEPAALSASPPTNAPLKTPSTSDAAPPATPGKPLPFQPAAIAAPVPDPEVAPAPASPTPPNPSPSTSPTLSSRKKFLSNVGSLLKRKKSNPSPSLKTQQKEQDKRDKEEAKQLRKLREEELKKEEKREKRAPTPVSNVKARVKEIEEEDRQAGASPINTPGRVRTFSAFGSPAAVAASPSVVQARAQAKAPDSPSPQPTKLTELPSMASLQPLTVPAVQDEDEAGSGLEMEENNDKVVAPPRQQAQKPYLAVDETSVEEPGVDQGPTLAHSDEVLPTSKLVKDEKLTGGSGNDEIESNDFTADRAEDPLGALPTTPKVELSPPLELAASPAASEQTASAFPVPSSGDADDLTLTGPISASPAHTPAQEFQHLHVKLPSALDNLPSPIPSPSTQPEGAGELGPLALAHTEADLTAPIPELKPPVFFVESPSSDHAGKPELLHEEDYSAHDQSRPDNDHVRTESADPHVGQDEHTAPIPSILLAPSPAPAQESEHLHVKVPSALEDLPSPMPSPTPHGEEAEPLVEDLTEKIPEIGQPVFVADGQRRADDDIQLGDEDASQIQSTMPTADLGNAQRAFAESEGVGEVTTLTRSASAAEELSTPGDAQHPLPSSRATATPQKGEAIPTPSSPHTDIPTTPTKASTPLPAVPRDHSTPVAASIPDVFSLSSPSPSHSPAHSSVPASFNVDSTPTKPSSSSSPPSALPPPVAGEHSIRPSPSSHSIASATTFQTADSAASSTKDSESELGVEEWEAPEEAS